MRHEGSKKRFRMSAIKKNRLPNTSSMSPSHYASQEFLNDLKREITDSIRDIGRRIDHVFHPERD